MKETIETSLSTDEMDQIIESEGNIHKGNTEEFEY